MRRRYDAPHCTCGNVPSSKEGRLRRHLLHLTCVVFLGFPAAVGAQTRDHGPSDSWLTTAATDRAAAANPAAASAPTSAETQAGGTPTSPLAIHVGDADLLIGGFMDATVGDALDESPAPASAPRSARFPSATPPTAAIERDALLGAELAPHAAGDEQGASGASIKGYLESDFLGNAPNGLNVTSNSNTLRMRLYWVQFTSGKFEFLGGPVVEHADAGPQRHLTDAGRHLLQPGRGHELPDGADVGPHARASGSSRTRARP